MAAARKKQFRVVAPIVTARMENSRLLYLYSGDVVPEGLTADSLKHLSDLGFISESKPEPEPKPEPSSESEPEPEN